MSETEKMDNMIYHVMDMVKERDACVIFPDEYDFGSVCSCHDCFEKTKRLKEFEEDLQCRRKLVTEQKEILLSKGDRCLALCSSSEWAIKMLDWLHNNLKILSKKSGLSLTLEEDRREEEMKHIHEVIVDLIVEHFIDKEYLYKSSEAADGEDTDILPLGTKINSMIYRYRLTKFNNATLGILEGVAEIEKEHEKDKKYAEARKEPLDPEVSKHHIEKQIKLVRQLPINELYDEYRKLVDEISPYREHSMWLGRAYLDIMTTFYDMIGLRFQFWLRYKNGKDKVKGHNLSGLKDTLESLYNEVDKFNGRWKDYAPHFTIYEELDAHCKRQQTM